MAESRGRADQAALFPLDPSPTYSATGVGLPWCIPKAYNVTGVLTQRNMAQMREQIKTPEKQLSDKERANLSNAQFKTLVIRMLTEMVEYGHKKRGKSEGYAK